MTPGYYFPVVPEEKLLKEGEPGILAIFILFVTDGYTMPALGNLVINVDVLSSDYLKLSSKLWAFLNAYASLGLHSCQLLSFLLR